MIDNNQIHEWIIDIIGVSSIAYAIYDIVIDTIFLEINSKFHLISWNKNILTDAQVLAKMTYIPAIVWGLIWLLLSIIAIKVVLFNRKFKGKKKYGG